MTQRTRTSLYTSLTLALAVAPAFAGSVTVYTNRTSWEAAVRSISTIDFEGIASAESYEYYGQPPGLAIGGVTFTAPSADEEGPTSNLFVVDPAYNTSYDWGSGAILSAQGGPDFIVASFDQPVSAFGVDLMSSFSADQVDFLIRLSTGEEYTVTTSVNPTRTFWGAVTDRAITWASFSPQTADALGEIDNFSVGEPAPEPASVGLGLVGIAWLIGLHRRGRG